MVAKDVIKVLLKNGWVHVRTTSSHYQFKHAGIRWVVTVPVHVSKDLGIGLLKQIEKKSGLSFEES